MTGWISKLARSLQAAVQASKSGRVVGLHQLKAAIEGVVVDHPAVDVVAAPAEACGRARRRAGRPAPGRCVYVSMTM
jgi:hypothetical protein